MNLKFFISYTKVDSDYARVIKLQLDSLGIECFLDEKNIEGGKDITRELHRNLKYASAIIVIATYKSIKDSPWVHYEIGFATALSKPLIPVLVGTSAWKGMPGFLKDYKSFKDEAEVFRTFGNREAIIRLLNQTPREPLNLEQLYLDWWEEQNEKREIKPIWFNGVQFLVSNSVFSPIVSMTYSSYQSAIYLSRVEKKRVLDVGTGCGVLAILAAMRGAREVVAIDHDPKAIDNTLENMKLHGITKRKIKPMLGNVYKTRDGRDIGEFDIIVGNLPIYFESSFWANNGDHGGKIDEFIAGLKVHMKKDGTAYLAWASFGKKGFIENLLRKHKFRGIPHRHETFGLTWIMYEISNYSLS